MSRSIAKFYSIFASVTSIWIFRLSVSWNFEIFFQCKKILLRDRIISGKRVSVCRYSRAYAASAREKHRDGVSRSTRLLSLHVSHGWTFVSSRVDSFAFLSRSLSREISSMPSAYYVSICVFPASAFHSVRNV